MTSGCKYNKILNKISSIFQEFCTIVEAIQNDFEEEHRQDPGLTMTIINYHLNIIKKYSDTFQKRSLIGEDMDNKIWTSEKHIKSTRQSISSFHREFDNPFLCSERWYQRIVQLLSELSDQARELDTLIQEN